jgi:hypothetical protein
MFDLLNNSSNIHEDDNLAMSNLCRGFGHQPTLLLFVRDEDRGGIVISGVDAAAT